MQTKEQILLKLTDNLKSYGLTVLTQKQYLRIARAFLEWSNRDAWGITERDVEHYLSYLKNVRNLSASTVNGRYAAIRLLLGIITGDRSVYPEPRRKLVKNGCLKDKREAFMQYLLDMGYAKKSLKNYRWTLKCLEQFMLENSLTEYSCAVGKAFMSDVVKSGRHTECILSMMTYIVRRFDCFMTQGEYILVLPRISRESPAQFAEGLAKYLGNMRLRGLRESTIEHHRYNIHKALLKFDAAGIQSYSEISPKIIYSVFEETSDKKGFCSPVRSLLRYLSENGMVKFDYSEYVPSIRKARPIPSVYTANETKNLLESVEASTNSSKRSHAIILLALRLGMRSGDIANLKITDIDFVSKSVNFIQEKTRVPQYLELLPEIEDALESYLYTVRPDSNLPNVFLSIRPPVRTISSKTVYSLVSHRFEKSGIETGERKRGGHALRTTLASELVAEKVPYDAVRKILGHEDPVSAKYYVKFDIPSLRSCSIEVPPVSGKLAAYMGARLGGQIQ